MEVTLLAIGNKMPRWVEDGYAEYAKRLGRDCKLTLKEIPSPRRSAMSLHLMSTANCKVPKV